MTKRNSDFEFKNNKKPKIDNGVDDLWGDDFDPDEVEEFVQTQLCSQAQSANESILPSYSAFKEFNKPSTSTQYLNGTLINGGLAHQHKDEQSLKKELETKNGEISMLRHQIKQLEVNYETAKRKVENEHREKQQKLHKCLIETESSLEFKNLEISHLKEKLHKLCKTSSATLTQPNRLNATFCGEMFKRPFPKIKDNVDVQKDNTVKLHDIPIFKNNIDISMDVLEPAMDDSNLIEKSESIQSTYNAVPILQNKFLENLTAIKHKPKYTIIENEILGLNYLQNDIKIIMKCSTDKINSSHINNHITKLLYVSYELLSNLLDVLKGIQSELTFKDDCDIDISPQIYTTNKEVSLFTGRRWFNKESGIEARRCIAILSELVLSNKYLVNVLCKKSCLTDSPEIDKLIECLQRCKEFKENNFTFLRKMEHVLQLITITKRGYYFTGLYCATLNLLGNISRIVLKDFPEEMYDIQGSCLGEIILSKPHSNVLKCIMKFLKTIWNKNIFYKLCKEADASSISTNKCSLHILSDQLKPLIDNLRIKMEYEFTMDVLQFCIVFISSINNYKSIYIRNKCSCMKNVWMLGMETVYTITVSTLESRTQNNVYCRPLKIEDIQVIHNCIKLLLLFCEKKIFLLYADMNIHASFRYVINLFNTYKDELKFEDDPAIYKDYTCISTYIIDQTVLINNEEICNSSLWDTCFLPTD